MIYSVMYTLKNSLESAKLCYMELNGSIEQFDG